jgi:ribokinase
MGTAPHVVAVGNITIDDAVLPDGRRQDDCLGGDALYAALAARLFDPAVGMIAPIGTGLPAAAAEAMRLAGFPPEDQPHRAVATIRNVVTYDEGGGRVWETPTTPEEFDALSVYPSDIDAPLRDARAFLVAAMSLDAQTTLVPWLRRHTDATVYLDLQEDYIPGNERLVLDMVAAAHVFLPSAEEVRRLLGTDDWGTAARILAALGPDLVVIKLAEEGCLVHEKRQGDIVAVGAAPADPVVDSTGAGDAFCGAFAAVHRATDDPIRAARAGAVAAAIAINGYGTSTLLTATPEDARARLADLA